MYKFHVFSYNEQINLIEMTWIADCVADKHVNLKQTNHNTETVSLRHRPYFNKQIVINLIIGFVKRVPVFIFADKDRRAVFHIAFDWGTGIER